MSQTTVIVLKEVLTQLIVELRRLCLEVALSTEKAYNAELKVRAMAELIERESEGSEFAFSQEKILKECGLEPIEEGASV